MNSFVKSITVSTALSGKVISVISGKVTEEMADYDTVVYYEDNCGIYHAVMQNDICKFLLRKPSLIVSPEGMLVFFTGKAILATVDCEHYYWVDWKMDLNYKSIKCIKVCKDSCEITLIDEKSKESTFRLTFEFDISEHQMIEPIITEL